MVFLRVGRRCLYTAFLYAVLHASFCFADQESSLKPATCPKHFAALDLTNIEVQSPKLAEFLSSRAYDRLIRTQPEALRAVPDQILAAPHGRTSLYVEGDKLRANIYVTKSDGAIDVEIGYVSMGAEGKGALGVLKTMTKLGKRNHSLNMLFPRVIAAVADGLDKQITADQSLKTISISGSKVVNLHLTKQLRELGFEPDKPKAFNLLINAFRKEGAYAVWIHNLASWTGLLGVVPDPLHLPIKLVKNAAMVFSAVRYRELGRNWKIEFQVKRETATSR